MQQTMIAAFRSRGRMLEVEQIRGWLIQIATRKSLDALRSSKREERLHRDLLPTDAPNGDDLLAQLGSTQDRRALEQCLGSLDPELLSAVLMRYQDGMSWERIADVLGLPLDTIRMRVQRGALKNLRNCLTSKEGKPGPPCHPPMRTPR